MDDDLDPAGARPKETYALHLTMSGAEQKFTDPVEAGAAFFRADPAERPYVLHLEDDKARRMAATHVIREPGSEETFGKSLPDSHASDGAFRTGYFNSMEASLSERLAKISWDAPNAENAVRDDRRLVSDLEALARAEPEKAAALWSTATDLDPPGPTLKNAVQLAEAGRMAEQEDPASTSAPVILAAGEWARTDQSVDLRPVAVGTEAGIHTGYEAILPTGEKELSHSARTFETAREALKHAFDFYEGGEERVEASVARDATLTRDASDDAAPIPKGVLITHEARPEFVRPEAAIYAGEDAQLVVSFERDTPATRALAEQLVEDPAFRKAVAAHVSDAAATIGTGRFVDGEGSQGLLPSESLALMTFDRAGEPEVIARFPDESPLSQTLARHLAENPVLLRHVADREAQAENWQSPEKAISSWVKEVGTQIEQLPKAVQTDLRAEMEEIAAEASAAFGAERDRGVPAVLEEAAPDQSDVREIAARHKRDLGQEEGRARASDITDQIIERAARGIETACSDAASREYPLLSTLQKMAEFQTQQEPVSFRTEEQAGAFGADLRARYGEKVLEDIAQGRTEALAKDFAEPSAREAAAKAILFAAKEHPALGVTVQEAERAERRLETDRAERAQPAPIRKLERELEF
ncbi:hypothetical protein [Rhodobacter maris]|uniref:Large polyvalent protein-associated domain-containing protein n=1 Tax=Rhodobacter maris TaxID=446682 RepID=A0A285TDT5_9RHOB|nr:hypothetical protein [Rhodobacter maris]SOC20380.1 hypothetical protein SAMN05877831_11920 [Rhodobacter maris]